MENNGEFSSDEKKIQRAILTVLERENRANLACVNPKNGVFEPLIAFGKKHLLTTKIFYKNRNIVVEMRESSPVMNFRTAKGLDRKVRGLTKRVESANASQTTKEGNGRWMHFLYDKQSSDLVFSAEVPIRARDRKDRITEIFQERFSIFIELLRMFYSGVFDEPKNLKKFVLRPAPRAASQTISQAA